MDAAVGKPPGDAAGESKQGGSRMRATKGYVAGLGTTTALIGAIGCAFAILSAAMAVHGWPLTLGSDPGVPTLEGGAAPPEGASLLAPGLLGAVRDAGAAPAPARRDGGRLVTSVPGGRGTLAGEPSVSALDAPAGAPAPAGLPRTGAATASTGGRPGTTPPTGGGTAGGGTPPPSSLPGSGAGASSTVGSTVTQVASGAGGAVTQVGQQLGGAVQDATEQVGGDVGQVSPAVGQTVTQTGQVAGGVVTGATGTVGQVVTGAGTAVGVLLGGR